MWPYNDCEWKTITYGVSAMKKRATKKLKEKIAFIVISILPSILMILGLMTLLK